MPYILQKDRPTLDEKVFALADEIAAHIVPNAPAVSAYYRDSFNIIADRIMDKLGLDYHDPTDICIGFDLEDENIGVDDLDDDFEKSSKYLADGIMEVSGDSDVNWMGNLNYSITRLIQAVPLKMVEKGEWTEPMRYWIYAQTVGALEGAAMDVNERASNHWIANGLIGVFMDIKDEYKRRVNTAYEAKQIVNNGDCYEMSPYRTKVVQMEDGEYKELMLPKQKPMLPWKED